MLRHLYPSQTDNSTKSTTHLTSYVAIPYADFTSHDYVYNVFI